MQALQREVRPRAGLDDEVGPLNVWNGVLDLSARPIYDTPGSGTLHIIGALPKPGLLGRDYVLHKLVTHKHFLV